MLLHDSSGIGVIIWCLWLDVCNTIDLLMGISKSNTNIPAFMLKPDYVTEMFDNVKLPVGICRCVQPSSWHLHEDFISFLVCFSRLSSDAIDICHMTKCVWLDCACLQYTMCCKTIGPAKGILHISEGYIHIKSWLGTASPEYDLADTPSIDIDSIWMLRSVF